MPPKRQAVAGNAKKAENAEIKKNAAQKVVDKAEDDDWAKGKKGSGKSDLAAEKAAALLRKKAENAKALADEEKSAPKFKAAPTKIVKKVVAPVMKIPTFSDSLDDEPTEFSASGIVSYSCLHSRT